VVRQRDFGFEQVQADGLVRAQPARLDAFQSPCDGVEIAFLAVGFGSAQAVVVVVVAIAVGNVHEGLSGALEVAVVKPGFGIFGRACVFVRMQRSLLDAGAERQAKPDRGEAAAQRTSN
jgi:hypothetical protein